MRWNPFKELKFREVVQSCKASPGDAKSELESATSSIEVFLFISKYSSWINTDLIKHVTQECGRSAAEFYTSVCEYEEKVMLPYLDQLQLLPEMHFDHITYGAGKLIEFNIKMQPAAATELTAGCHLKRLTEGIAKSLGIEALFIVRLTKDRTLLSLGVSPNYEKRIATHKSGGKYAMTIDISKLRYYNYMHSLHSF